MKQSIPLALVASFSSSSSSSCFDRSFCHPVSGAPGNKLFRYGFVKNTRDQNGENSRTRKGIKSISRNKKK